jgi:hypothetical protein
MKIVLKRILCLYCCCLLNLNASSFPQKSISYSTGTGTPISTSTADTLAKGEIGISQRTEYYSNTSLSEQVLLQNPLTQNQQATLTNYLMLFYGLEHNITIGANLPYILNSSMSAASINPESSSQSITHLGSSYGLGDANLFSMWRLFAENKRSVALSILSGINVPTGKTTVRDNNGSLFAASDQPGGGAWTPFAGIIISKQFNKFSISSNLIYTQSTEGSQQTTLGSIFDYNFATVLELYKNQHTKFQISGIMEILGEYAGKDNISGVLDQNSGGNSVYLSPGLRVNMNATVSCYLGVNIPLIQYYYGTQVKNEYGITGGIDITI